MAGEVPKVGLELGQLLHSSVGVVVAAAAGPHHDDLLGELQQGVQLLPLHLGDVVLHLVDLVALGVPLQLPDQLLVGARGADRPELVVASLRLDFLADAADLLHLRLQARVLLDEEAVDVVEFGLQGHLQVVGDVLDLPLEVAEVVLEARLLSLDPVLEGGDVALLLAQQEQQLLREYLGIVEDGGEVAVLARSRESRAVLPTVLLAALPGLSSWRAVEAACWTGAALVVGVLPADAGGWWLALIVVAGARRVAWPAEGVDIAGREGVV